MDETGRFSGTTGLAEPGWPIAGPRDLAGGITADRFQAALYRSWGSGSNALP